MSRPANRMHPESGVISPASCPISVVLPAPFGPMMTWSSPFGHIELDIVRGNDALEALEQALDLKQRVRHRHPQAVL